MSVFKNIESEIERIISKSEIPEYSKHSKNIRVWVLSGCPKLSWKFYLAKVTEIST
jgi:hypothetical protein